MSAYTIKELIDKAYQELLDSGLSPKTVYGSNWYIWNRLQRKYGANTLFDEKMIFEYCYEYFNKDIFNEKRSNISFNEYRYTLAFKALLKVYHNEAIPKFNIHYHRDYTLDEKSNLLLKNYITKCEFDGNGNRTLQNKYNRIRNFIIDIDLPNITTTKIQEYIKGKLSVCRPISYIIEFRLIRNFLLYCYEHNYISKEILLAWPNNTSSNYGKDIPSVYSNDEIKTLLTSAKNYKNEDNHLRNYAILCLITYSGIRISDVINLKLSNFNWRTNQIKFVQQKTKKEHVIPLIPEIGNPIIEYIKEERHGNSSYVFTKENGEKISKSAVVTTIINNYFCIAPIEINGRHYGPHALRHSMATRLINNKVDGFSVANVLGHSCIQCVNIYAKVNLENLRKCVLEAPYHA